MPVRWRNIFANRSRRGWNIATCLTPTQWIPVAILGVLQAGDTCVPLDHTASKAWLVRKVDEYDVELVICDSQTALSFEGTSKKLLIIDQQWEEISANQSKEFSPSAKAVIALTGSEDEEAPVLKSYDAGSCSPLFANNPPIFGKSSPAPVCHCSPRRAPRPISRNFS